MTPESARLRGLLANQLRHYGPGPEADRLARELRVTRAQEYVCGLLDLPLDRRARLAAQLLAPSGEGA
jgi:hypothetical protein